MSRMSPPSLPTLRRFPAPLAAAFTGLVCGGLVTGLVWSGERGCDATRGQPSCGGYGLGMLLVIVVVCFVVGVLLLKVFGVAEPGVTTFFGLALPMLLILGLLLDHVFDHSMAIAFPLIVAVGFVLSTYLARALEAANPSSYVDDRVAAGSADSSAATDSSSEQVATRDDLPRYAPGEGEDRRP
jgi:hypothetical protein